MSEKEEILKRAKKRLEKLIADERKSNEVGRECMQFVAGEQWKVTDLKDRESTNRPVITINKLANFVNIVVNENAQEMARIKVAPFEDADVDTAKVVNGLLRHIQYNDKSNAGEAFSHAFFCLVCAGKGFFRIETQYCDEESFDQEIIVSKIEDPFSVWIDKDREYAFVAKFIDKDDFEEEYPNKESGSWDVDGLRAGIDEVVILEYWELQKTKYELYKVKIDELTVIEESEVSIDDEIMASVEPTAITLPSTVQTLTKEEKDLLPEGSYEVLAQRTANKIKVKQYILSSSDILEESDWSGSVIPIIGAYGREFELSTGEKFRKPLVYDAIDSQRLYNYYKSQDAEWMQMAPKQPFIGAKGSFKGVERKWSNANTSHVPYLEYEPVVKDGQLMPPPQRQAPTMPNQGFYQNMALSSDEIKATMGLFDPSLGDVGNEQSGKAIIARQQQGNKATYHFTQFFNDAMRVAGLVEIDLIPHIYDAPRTIRIIGEDMADEVIKINQSYRDEKTGKERLYDLKTGKYDLKIETGPSSITRRMDAAENWLNFAKIIPTAGAAAPDYFAKNLHFEGAEDLADRMKASVDPIVLQRSEQFKAEREGGPTQQMIALSQMQQQLVQSQQQMIGMAKENQALKKQIDMAKVQVAQIAAQAKIQDANIRARTDINVAQMNNETDLRQEMMKQRNRSTPSGSVPAGGRQ